MVTYSQEDNEEYCVNIEDTQEKSNSELFDEILELERELRFNYQPIEMDLD